MADFDAILRKALASRPGAPGEERRKIYDRARQALVRQLTGFEPPLPPEDISRQRLALEGAIRKVEAEVAANGGFLPGTAAPAAPAAAPRPAPVSRATPTAPPAAAPAPAPRAPISPPVARRPEPPVAAPAPPPVAAPVAAPLAADPLPSFDERPAPPVDSAPQAPLPDFDPAGGQAPPPPKKSSNAAGLIIGLVALVLVAAGGVVAWQLGFFDTGSSNQQVASEQDETLEEAPDVRTIGDDPTRSSERLLPDNQGTVEDAAAETEQATSQPETTGLPVAQSAILYEEGLTPEADGFTAPGRALWRLDETGDSPAIVGTIEVPARGITLGMRITRNFDDALPASHLIEFDFDLSEPFPSEGIAELVGVVVKPQEQSGGDPFRGAIVDLGEGVFWQALASGEADQVINLPLLRDGRWFDLPLLYADNRRAIITFEKGEDGVAIFNQALNAWSN